MISQKDVKTIHWEKGPSFQQMSVEKLDIQIERMKYGKTNTILQSKKKNIYIYIYIYIYKRMKLNPYLTLYTQIK